MDFLRDWMAAVRCLFGALIFVLAAAPAAAQDDEEPIEYVRVCSLYGAGYFYIPGTEICITPDGETREQTSYGTLRYLDRGTIALQGVVMAMAMPNPYIEYGKNFAVAGNFAYYAGSTAVAFAAAMRVTPNVNFNGSLAYGIDMGVLAARFGLTWSDVAVGGGSTLGLSEPPRADFKRAFAANISIFGGLWEQTFQLGDFDQDSYGGWMAGALARVRFPAGASHAWQFDVWADTALISRTSGPPGNEATSSRSTLGFAAHFTHEVADNVRLGTIGSLGYLSSGGWGTKRGRGYFNAGLEGTAPIGNAVVLVQGGYVFGFREYGKQAAYGHASLRYFPVPDFMVEANGGVAYFDPDGQIDSLLYRWTLRLEKQLANRNVSIFGEYNGNYLDRARIVSPGWSSEYSILAGARFLVGEGTLHNSALKGASLTDHNPIFGQNRIREN